MCKHFGYVVRKECRWISNNRGEEFQRVGRTIFINSKVLTIVSTQIFKILTFFLSSYNPFK